ncbi:helix-turn-helix domain-containing protein [Enterococcus casseliflavus]|nr:helix-turn-helix domain-containing protein [Enterococcus casseliflavus]
MKSIHKNENQEVDVLKYLDRHARKWVTTEEIASNLNISRVTVNKIIKSIQARVSKNPNINIEILQNKGIFFNATSSIYIVGIIQSIYRNSLTYKLITALLNETIVSLDQFAINQFISLASIRRKISTINDILSDSSICIKNNRIVGDEQNIRSFLFKYYWEIHRGTEWPFVNVDKQKLVSLSDKVSDTLNVWCSQVSYEQIYYLLAIARLRYKKSHIIEKKQEFIERVENNKLFDVAKKIWLEEFPFLNLCENELQYYFFVVSSFSLNYIRTDYKKLLSLKQMYQKQNTFSYLITKKLFSQIEQIYNIKNLEKKQPLLFLELLMYHNRAFTISSDILITSLDRSYFVGKMKHNYPVIFNRLTKTISTIVKEFPQISKSKNYLLEIYSMFYFQALRTFFLKKIKLFVSLTAGRSMEKMIVHDIKQYFEDKFIIEETANEEEADICITDSEFYHFRKSNILYVIEPRLTDRDFSYLEKILS